MLQMSREQWIRMGSIMLVSYKDHTIKVMWNAKKTGILYGVYSSEGYYWGFKYTIVQAREWIDRNLELREGDCDGIKESDNQFDTE